MAAMTTALLCQLSAGDHVVGARAAFGSCRWLLDHLLPRFGIETSVIDSADNDAWEAAIRPNTKVFFFETPANPTLDVVDLAHVCSVARAHGITTVVDNAFATSALQRPMDFGADVVKVERPGVGDDTRGWGPPYLKDQHGENTSEAAYYLTANRNKQSLTVDFTRPRPAHHPRAGGAVRCTAGELQGRRAGRLRAGL